MGGDFHDAFELAGEKSLLVMADVSGKGLRAAVLAASAKYTIHAHLRYTADLSEACARISSAIYQEHVQDMFVTAFIGVLDRKTGGLEYDKQIKLQVVKAGRGARLLLLVGVKAPGRPVPTCRPA